MKYGDLELSNKAIGQLSAMIFELFGSEMKLRGSDIEHCEVDGQITVKVLDCGGLELTASIEGTTFTKSLTIKSGEWSVKIAGTNDTVH
ncbi:hypothetical protein COB18_01985 [Candidatus Kaiserbacteria bacterium]|nr:MAG: hypothetical protein COB18_01985 [Candidatus Kaiserbacteria bacterium]